MKLERSITDEIIDFLSGIPDSFVVKIHGNRMQASGMPDLHFTCRQAAGRAFWFETKRCGERERKLQAFRIRQLRAAGAVAHVVRGVDEVRGLLIDNGVLIHERKSACAHR